MNRIPHDTPLSLDITSEIPKAGPEIYILRMKANKMFTFTILSEHPYGIWVHWNGKKSEPHFKQEDRCPGCLAKRSKRWKCYLHTFCVNLSQEVFLELTPHSAKSLEGQLGAGQSYRGNRIQVQRTASDNGRLLISLLTRIDPKTPLPPQRDPLESILSLWGIDPGSLLGGKELPTRAPARNGTFH